MPVLKQASEGLPLLLQHAACHKRIFSVVFAGVLDYERTKFQSHLQTSDLAKQNFSQLTPKKISDIRRFHTKAPCRPASPDAKGFVPSDQPVAYPAIH